MISKILLVEDNSLFRKTVRRIIRSRFERLEVEEALDTREAREKVSTFRPDVVFMDVRLPDGDGIQLTESIKSEHPEIIVVMLTNLDSEEYREASAEAGADEFISKRGSARDAITETLEHILRNGRPKPSSASPSA